jgi:hypothetical protein
VLSQGGRRSDGVNRGNVGERIRDVANGTITVNGQFRRQGNQSSF